MSRTGGAVAVVSATEEAFSSQNANLNFVLYQQLFKTRRDHRDVRGFGRAGSGRGEDWFAKQSEVSGARGFGGATRPPTPVPGRRDGGREWLLRSTACVAGRPSCSRAQLLGGPAGAPLLHDRIVHVLIEDSAPVDTLPDCFVLCDSQPPPPAPLCFVPCSYPFRASPMFRGDVSMTGGRFETRFVVPMNARLGPRGRARGYGEVQNGAAPTDAVGRAALAIVSGTAPTTDRTGPRIGLSFVSGSTRVRPDAVMQIDLFDESGILITGNVAQNGIIVTVDQNSSQRFEVTSSFRYAANSYQSGTASFRLPGLSSGKHRIDVSAADNLAAGITAGEHRSSAFIEFEVTQQLGLHVTRTILFPNPIRSGGSGSEGSS